MVLLSDKNYKARKQHRCYWCNRAIDQGEIYNREAQVFQGEFIEIKAHLVCKKVVDLWWKRYGKEFEEDGIDNEFYYDMIDLIRKTEMRSIRESGLVKEFGDLCKLYELEKDEMKDGG